VLNFANIEVCFRLDSFPEKGTTLNKTITSFKLLGRNESLAGVAAYETNISVWIRDFPDVVVSFYKIETERKNTFIACVFKTKVQEGDVEIFNLKGDEIPDEFEVKEFEFMRDWKQNDSIEDVYVELKSAFSIEVKSFDTMCEVNDENVLLSIEKAASLRKWMNLIKEEIKLQAGLQKVKECQLITPMFSGKRLTSAVKESSTSSSDSGEEVQDETGQAFSSDSEQMEIAPVFYENFAQMSVENWPAVEKSPEDDCGLFTGVRFENGSFCCEIKFDGKSFRAKRQNSAFESAVAGNQLCRVLGVKSLNPQVDQMSAKYQEIRECSTCLSGHYFCQIRTPGISRNDLMCGGCKKLIVQGGTIARCRECKFDLCRLCYSRTFEPEEPKAPKSNDNDFTLTDDCEMPDEPLSVGVDEKGLQRLIDYFPFKGAYQDKKSGRWRSQIRYQGKCISGGVYPSREEAALASNSLCRAFHRPEYNPGLEQKLVKLGVDLSQFDVEVANFTTRRKPRTTQKRSKKKKRRTTVQKNKRTHNRIYKGIYSSKCGTRWLSRVRCNGKEVYGGTFDCQLDAAIASNKICIERKRSVLNPEILGLNHHEYLQKRREEVLLVPFTTRNKTRQMRQKRSLDYSRNCSSNYGSDIDQTQFPTRSSPRHSRNSDVDGDFIPTQYFKPSRYQPAPVPEEITSRERRLSSYNQHTHNTTKPIPFEISRPTQLSGGGPCLTVPFYAGRR